MSEEEKELLDLLATIYVKMIINDENSSRVCPQE
jgi:hypothetical protein